MRQRRTPFIAAGLAVALALAGAALAATVSHTATATTTIKVTEREIWPEELAKASVTFVVHTVGKISHRLSVAGAGLSKPVSTLTIKPGKTRTLTVKVAGGKLSLWCPVPGHAALGMKIALKVAGAPAATTGGGAYSVPTTTGTYVWG